MLRALPDFGAMTVDGFPVRAADLRETPTLIVFLDTGCHVVVSALEKRIRAFREDGGRTLVVIAADSPDDPLARQLVKLTNVVVERTGGPLQEAFGVDACPASFVVEYGLAAETHV